MIYAYLVISAALIPILNNFFPILRENYSFWLVPLLFLGFFIAFIIIQFLILLIMILTANTAKPISKKGTIFHFFIVQCLPIIFWLARVKINKEYLAEIPEGRFLLVCNHQHDFDPAVILTAVASEKLAFIGKKEIYTEMPFVSKAMHRLNSLPIDRENNREAAKTIISAVKLIKENVTSVALFPEGYTSPTCELLPFRNGSLKVATKAGVPIVVCVLNNTRAIPKNIFLKKTKVSFKLLDVIMPEAYENLTSAELGDIIHSKIKSALQELRAE